MLRNRNDRFLRNENRQEVHEWTCSTVNTHFSTCSWNICWDADSIRYEEDFVDQLFNSSEKRPARILLLLAHFGKEGNPRL